MKRIRVLLENTTMSFDEARQQVMATNVFTTHTPVPAGIDTFSPELMLKYFKNFIPSLKLSEEGFLALGREDVSNPKQGFSMAVLAIRLADGTNAVAITSAAPNTAANQCSQRLPQRYSGAPNQPVKTEPIASTIKGKVITAGDS